MGPTIILLANGFFLSLILFILLVILALKKDHHPTERKEVKEDLKKIKDQINGK
jgi:hypothetical protein